MAKTLEKLTEQEMQELADKLINTKLSRARGYTRRLDPDSDLQMFRQGLHGQLLTVYILPNLGVKVTLIEEPAQVAKGDGTDKLKAEPRYVEALVEALA